MSQCNFGVYNFGVLCLKCSDLTIGLSVEYDFVKIDGSSVFTLLDVSILEGLWCIPPVSEQGFIQ